MTEKEEERLNLFQQKSDALVSQGYTRHDLMISPMKANVGSLLVTLPFDIIIAIFYFISKPNFSNDFVTYLICYVLFIICIVIHELIHGITWAFYNKNHWKAIAFGFNAKACAPYCTCNETLTKKQYIIGALMPTLFLGFLPGIICIFNGSFILFLLSMFMIIGGGGDFLMIINILKFKPEATEIIYYDHPTEIGTVAFYK